MYSNAKMDMVASSKEALEAPAIQTGQNEISVDVTLTYEVE